MTFPAQGGLRSMSRSEGRPTVFMSSLQMTGRKACLDTKIPLHTPEIDVCTSSSRGQCTHYCYHAFYFSSAVFCRFLPCFCSLYVMHCFVHVGILPCSCSLYVEHCFVHVGILPCSCSLYVEHCFVHVGILPCSCSLYVEHCFVDVRILLCSGSFYVEHCFVHVGIM